MKNSKKDQADLFFLDSESYELLSGPIHDDVEAQIACFQSHLTNWSSDSGSTLCAEMISVISTFLLKGFVLVQF